MMNLEEISSLIGVTNHCGSLGVYGQLVWTVDIHKVQAGQASNKTKGGEDI